MKSPVVKPARNVTLSDLVATIDGGRRQGNLSSAIRLFVLDYYRSQCGGDHAGSEPATNGALPQPSPSVVGSE